jgi:hypothetical protein
MCQFLPDLVIFFFLKETVAYLVGTLIDSFMFMKLEVVVGVVRVEVV